MVRKPVELERGAIHPQSHGLWGRAKEKLLEAQHGLDQMHQAKTRVGYEAGWTRFVDSLEEFWVRFYQEGQKSFSDFQPWAGRIEADRKRDELLQYFYQHHP